jgi:hypothetical protein
VASREGFEAVWQHIFSGMNYFVGFVLLFGTGFYQKQAATRIIPE